MSAGRRQPQRIARAFRQHGGFTLVELLVVIVILGILSAVVVFAVRGVGDKGRSNAVTTEARILRTAEEARCAQKGTYADVSTLVREKFLSDSPGYHRVEMIAGRCGGTGYRLKEIGTPSAPVNPGAWSLPKVTQLPNGIDQQVVVLGDGSVLRVVLPVEDGPWAAERWLPTIDTWIPVSGPPIATTEARAGPITVINGPNCGLRCGDVLFEVTAHIGSWMLYDPDAGPTGAWTTPLGQPQYPANHSARFAPLVDGTNCATQCGKVLAAGGQHDYPNFPDPPPAESRISAEVYDPVGGQWTRTGNMLSDAHSNAPALITLTDGSVLLVDSRTSTSTPAERYFPSDGLWRAAGSPTTHTAGLAQLVGLGERVLFSGGAASSIYTPAGFGGSWSLATGCDCPDDHVAIALADENTVLLVSAGGTTGAQLYDTDQDTLWPAAALGQARTTTQAVRLQDGRVMVVGGGTGSTGSTDTATYEIFDPAA